MTSMSRRLSRLVLTELESYVHDLVVWGGALFFLFVLFFSFMGTVVTRSGDTLAERFGPFLLSMGLSSVLLAIKVSQQNAIEKRPRLFSQLPVTTREVSFANWCVRLLCLSIPTLAFAVFLASATDMRFATFALVTLAIYLGGTTLVAAISVAMSIRHLPAPMSTWAKGVYIVGAILAVVIWFVGNLLVFPWPPAIARLTGVGLPGLTFCLMVSGVGLVVVDVWLRNRLDDYLG